MRNLHEIKSRLGLFFHAPHCDQYEVRANFASQYCNRTQNLYTHCLKVTYLGWHANVADVCNNTLKLNTREMVLILLKYCRKPFLNH